MRLKLALLFVLISFQISSAQENSNPIISIDNAQSLSPLFTINEEFWRASFSQFEEDGTALLLVNSEVINDRYESTIATWDLSLQEITNTIVFASNGAIYNPMQISLYSKIATISIGGSVVIQNYPEGSSLRQFNSSSIYYTIATISPDGRRLVFTECVWREHRLGCYPETWFFMIYDTASLEIASTIDIQLEQFDILNDYSVTNLALSDYGRFLLIEGTTELNIFDTRTRERVLLDEDRCRVHHASFIAETRILAVRPPCDGDQSSQIVVWDFETGVEDSIFSYQDAEFRYMELNPDRTILGVLTSTSLYLINFSTGEILKEIASVGSNFDFSPDGRYLLLGNLIYGIEND